MNSSITIVTAFFDIGRANWSKNKGFMDGISRTSDDYLNWFETLARLKNPMIIYTSSEFVNKVKALRYDRPTLVIELDFFKKFHHILNKINKVLNDEEFKQKIPTHQKDKPEYISAGYILVNNLKPFFVTNAWKKNLIKTKLAAWIDFGYGRYDTIPKDDNFEWRYDFDLNKMHLFVINKKLIFPSFITQKIATKKMLNGSVYIIGPSQVGSQSAWISFYKIITAEFIKFYNKKHVDDDQFFYVQSYFQNKRLFQLNYLGKGNWFGAISKFNNFSK